MCRRHPRTTRTYSLLPYTSLFRSLFYVFAGGRRYRGLKELAKRKRIKNSDTFPVEVRTKEEAIELSLAENFQREDMHPADSIRARPDDWTEIGRAHVCTPVTHAHLVCRLLLVKNNINPNRHT